MNRLRKTAVLTLLLVSLLGCDLPEKSQSVLLATYEVGADTPTPSRFVQVQAQPSTMPAPVVRAPVVTYATLAAVGDILIHDSVYKDAKKRENDYDFSPMFMLVREHLLRTDLAVANQESIIGGQELGLSSYPLFNSPHEIGDALLSSGITLVTTANNHAIDMGEKGIVSAAAYWNKIGLPYTGAFVSQEDRNRIRTLERNGISFGFLAYTHGTNGLAVPAGKPYLVNRIDDELIKDDIDRARKLVDVVVVAVHWGLENEPKPNNEQLSLARKLADWGADIVIGTHPHVLQPFVWIPRPDGKRTLVMYSLGNFLSAQDKMPQLIGGIARIDAVKTVVGDATSIELKNPAFLPTYNKYESFRHFRIVPFGQLDRADAERIKPLWEPIKQRLVAGLPELDVHDLQ